MLVTVALRLIVVKHGFRRMEAEWDIRLFITKERTITLNKEHQDPIKMLISSSKLSVPSCTLTKLNKWTAIFIWTCGPLQTMSRPPTIKVKGPEACGATSSLLKDSNLSTPLDILTPPMLTQTFRLPQEMVRDPNKHAIWRSRLEHWTPKKNQSQTMKSKRNEIERRYYNLADLGQT